MSFSAVLAASISETTPRLGALDAVPLARHGGLRNVAWWIGLGVT
jgi:hypothetical protein